ncbi:MAG: hypothetical protein QMD04_03555 [Anaerolineales bacterium]|nr:hypothetical protein [Anaerolineales bacterium]
MSDLQLRYVVDASVGIKLFVDEEFSEEKKLTAYDACYAILAQKIEIPLITADEPLARAVETAIFIGDLGITPFVEE